MKVLLTICCLVIGFGFYKTNQNDWINATALTVGLLGIMLSATRKTPERGNIP